MVLAELGKGLTSALAKLQTTTVIDDNVVNDVIKEVSNALLHVLFRWPQWIVVGCESSYRDEAAWDY